MDADHIVEVRGLTAGYAGQAVLHDINFRVRRGEIFMILGGSGSGKSTLLKNMIGLYPAMSGEVFIGGDDIVGARGAAREKILRKFGVMYQGGALFGSMSLEGNVALPLEDWTRLPAAARALLARLKLQQVGLDGFAGYLPSEISGGMQKRAAVARAMALDPPLLFLACPPCLMCSLSRLRGRSRRYLARCSTEAVSVHQILEAVDGECTDPEACHWVLGDNHRLQRTFGACASNQLRTRS